MGEMGWESPVISWWLTLSFGKCVYNCRTPEPLGQDMLLDIAWANTHNTHTPRINSAGNASNANTKNLIKSAFSKLNCSLCIREKETGEKGCQGAGPYLSPAARHCPVIVRWQEQKDGVSPTFSIWPGVGVGAAARTSLYSAVCGSVSTCP